MNYTDNDYEKSLSNAIESILIDNRYDKIRFYGIMLLTIQKEFVDGIEPESGEKIDTAALMLFTDRYKIVINKKFWFSTINMDKEKRVGLLIHEILHSIYNHPLRLKDYPDYNLFQEAVDLFVNSIIIKDIGENHLPGYAGNDYDIKYRYQLDTLMSQYRLNQVSLEEVTSKLSQIPIRPIVPSDYNNPNITVDRCIELGTEYIYGELYKIKEEENKSNGNGSGDDSGDGNGNGNSNNHVNNNCNIQKNINGNIPQNHDTYKTINNASEGLKNFIQNQQEFYLREALSEFEKIQGSLPGYLKDYLAKILNPPKPKFDYKKFIREWVSIFGNMTDIGRTRTKPSIVIEDQYRLKMVPGKYLLVGVDTSGSMTKEDLNEVFTELYNIKRNTSCKIDVCEVDARINDVFTFETLDELNNKISTGISGRGGTMVEPLIDYVNDNPQYSGVFYLTDGHLSAPRKKCLKPMLVIVSSGGTEVKWKNIISMKLPKKENF